MWKFPHFSPLTCLEVCGGRGSFAREEPLQSHLDHPHTSLLTGTGNGIDDDYDYYYYDDDNDDDDDDDDNITLPVERHRLGATLHDVDVQMILEIQFNLMK